MTKGGKKMLARIKKFEDELSEMGAYISQSIITTISQKTKSISFLSALFLELFQH